MSNRTKGIAAFALGLILLCLVGITVKQTLTVRTVQTTLAQVQKENRRLTKKKDDQQAKLAQLKKENKKMITAQLVDKNSDIYTEFTTNTTLYFKTRFTYEPKTYKASKDKVKDLISPALSKQFSDNQAAYEDGNNVSSRVTALDIYSGSVVNGQIITGLLTIDYENKMADFDWTKTSEVYTVQYDTTSHQLTKIQSLGSILRGDMIE